LEPLAHDREIDVLEIVDALRRKELVEAVQVPRVRLDAVATQASFDSSIVEVGLDQGLQGHEGRVALARVSRKKAGASRPVGVGASLGGTSRWAA
jgi:hypothetical protein